MAQKSEQQKDEPRDSNDWLLALCLGVLVGGLLAATSPATLGNGAYAHVLHVVQNQPASPAEILMRGAYSMLGSVLGGSGINGQLAFFKNLPLFLGALSAMLAYGTLRFLNFSRMESVLASGLAMLAPAVGLAFFPGLLAAEMLAIPMILLGLLGIALVASEKKEKTDDISPTAFLGLLLGIAGFAGAIWIYPWASLILAALLVGSLLEAKEHLHDLSKMGKTAWMRLVALVLPLGVLSIVQMQAFVVSFSSILFVLQHGWMLGGLAFVSFVALQKTQRHPQAVMYAVLTAAGLLMGGVSPAAAMLAWMMPAAYGLHALRDWENDTLVMRVAMVTLLVGIPLFGLMSGAQGWMQAAGSSVLVAAGVVAMVHLWGWSSGMVRAGASVFLLAAAMMSLAVSIAAIGGNVMYAYSPLDADSQAALIWIGNSSQLAGTQVASLATPEAVQLLAHGNSAMSDKEMLAWLGASRNSSSSLAPGTLIVVPVSVFDLMPARENDIGHNWTLNAFRFVGKTADSPPLAVFDSNQNLRILHPLDGYGNLAAERSYLFTMPGQAYAKTLTIGDVQLLHPSENISDDGNLLIWPNDELNSRVLGIFEDKLAGYSVVYETQNVRVLRVN